MHLFQSFVKMFEIPDAETGGNAVESIVRKWQALAVTLDEFHTDDFSLLPKACFCKLFPANPHHSFGDVYAGYLCMDVGII